jgi:hypothetical protein
MLTSTQHKDLGPAWTLANWRTSRCVGHHPVTARLKATIEVLQMELAKVEASAAGYRADLERERERADRLTLPAA